MPNGKKQHKYYGAAGSILIHLAVIVALILITITPPPQQEEDEGGGILVMVGSIVEDTPSNKPTPKIERHTPTTNDTEQEINTQDLEESINLEEEQKRTEEEKKRLEEEAKEKSRIDAMITSAFEGGESSSGNTEGAQLGMPNGTSTSGAISVNVGYGSYDLGGRGLKQGETLPKPTYDNSNDEGSIAIRITVNPQGKVIQAQAIPTGSKGTAYQNRTLRERAIKSAYMALFQESADKSNQQGVITYHFKQR